jgi:hypothetical protein
MNLRNVTLGLVIMLLVIVYRHVRSGGKCKKCGSYETRRLTRVPRKDKIEKKASRWNRKVGHFEQKYIYCIICGHERQTSYKYVRDGRSWRHFHPF